MQKPGRLDFTPEQIEGLLDRIDQECLEKRDYPVLADLIRAIVWMNLSLQEKELTIRRLRSIFGIKTETAKKLLDVAQGQNTGQGNKEEKKKDPKKGKHGHKPATAFTEAKTINVAHQTLKKRDLCPSCRQGKLFSLKPGSVIRIIGQPWLQVEIYRPERLRCSSCSKTFTAALPKEIAIGSRTDSTAKATVSILKYRGGLPFYRQQQMQEMLGAPLSASEIWQMTEEVADSVHPIYAVLCQKAANAQVLQNDDTAANILSIKQEIKDEKRKGIFTTAILATLTDRIRIGLFFTGRKHAGENLNDLLNNRERGPPIQQCDAASRNVPKDHETRLANCLAHARRKFYELIEVWPQVVTKLIGLFASVYINDREAPVDSQERLGWHQEKSTPVMQEIKSYCDTLLQNKEVEPNSSLGKAIAYLNNHWEAFTLFLRVPGVPLTNNEGEQLIKRAVLNRKNAYFFRNETGAKIADIIMSVIETCVYNGINPWNYLVAVQTYERDVRSNPQLWLPWVYESRFKELQPQ
ncbi:MAG: IS66 family transposase [Chlamydiales bacterium]